MFSLIPCQFMVGAQSIIMTMRLRSPMNHQLFLQTLCLATGILYQKLATHRNLIMSLTGKSPTRLTWPGKQDTQSMHLMNRSYGISQIALIGLSMQAMRRTAKFISKENTILIKDMINQTADRKVIKSAGSCTATKTLEDTWRKSGDQIFLAKWADHRSNLQVWTATTSLRKIKMILMIR